MGGGNYAMRIGGNKPDGEPAGSTEFKVFFNGSDDNGVAVISPMTIPNPEEGLHWFDVYFEGQLMTRVPMRVLHQQIQMGFPQ
jgi:hypothetical protein